MMETISAQEAKLREEILSEARGKAERAVARAKNEADGLRRKCRQDIAARRKARIAEVTGTAEDEAKGMLQNVERQVRSMWLNAREECVNGVFARALAECEGFQGERRERSYAALSKEALNELGVTEGVVNVRFPADCAGFITESWLKSVTGGNGVSFALDATGEPGVVMTSSDGQMMFDNTYRARLRFMREELRTILSRS